MSHLVRLVVLAAFLTVSPATAAPPPSATPAVAAVDAKVNINTADVKELMKLAGVGRSLAEKIVQYRDAHGPFKKADGSPEGGGRRRRTVGEEPCTCRREVTPRGTFSLPRSKPDSRMSESRPERQQRSISVPVDNSADG